MFESRDPARRGWEEWTREATWEIAVTRAGRVESWVELTLVEPPLVAFRWTFRFLDSGEELVSDSTLRFRERDELEAALHHAGFEVIDVRDAPDRPGREMVFIAVAAC